MAFTKNDRLFISENNRQLFSQVTILVNERFNAHEAKELPYFERISSHHQTLHGVGGDPGLVSKAGHIEEVVQGLQVTRGKLMGWFLGVSAVSSLVATLLTIAFRVF